MQVRSAPWLSKRSPSRCIPSPIWRERRRFIQTRSDFPRATWNHRFWCEFEVGGNTFGIGNFEQVGKAGTAQSLALEIDDVAALRTKLAGMGIVASEPHELQTCWISVVADPDGNQIWLHQKKT